MPLPVTMTCSVASIAMVVAEVVAGAIIDDLALVLPLVLFEEALEAVAQAGVHLPQCCKVCLQDVI